jgi:hypothetical protein
MFKHHSILRPLTGGLVIAAAGLPASSQARIFHDRPVPSLIRSIRLPDTPYSNRALRPDGSASGASVRVSSQPGFPWGDAGIGAGAAVLLGAAATAAGMTRRRRIQRTVGG